MSDETEELAQLAAAHALDALDADDARRFEASLARNPELQAEVKAYREVATAIGLGEATVAPPEGLKARLSDRIRSLSTDAQPSATSVPPVNPAFSLDLDALKWTKAEIAPGFLVHWLRRDEGTGELALLLKGEPGATLPDHAHPGGEHFFILHGAFSDQHDQYSVGDFRTMAPGSEHRSVRVSGDEPCILLVITGPGGITPIEGSAGTP